MICDKNALGLGNQQRNLCLSLHKSKEKNGKTNYYK
nr:MAG TPA: hypothetical protein [Caudoviricetes sp.]